MMLKNIIKIIFGVLIMVAAWSGFRDMMFTSHREAIWIVGQMLFIFSLILVMGLELLSRDRFTLKTMFKGSVLALAAVPAEIGSLIWETEEPGWIVAWTSVGLLLLMLVYVKRLQWLVGIFRALRAGREGKTVTEQGLLRENQTSDREEGC